MPLSGTGDEEVETEAEVEDDGITGENYWKRKEVLRTVSLAVGDHFSSGTCILDFNCHLEQSGKRIIMDSNGRPDSAKC